MLSDFRFLPWEMRKPEKSLSLFLIFLIFLTSSFHNAECENQSFDVFLHNFFFFHFPKYRMWNYELRYIFSSNKFLSNFRFSVCGMWKLEMPNPNFSKVSIFEVSVALFNLSFLLFFCFLTFTKENKEKID